MNAELADMSTSPRDRWLLLVLTLAILLPGVFGVSLFDRDEGWYAQVSREMLASVDWLLPTYLGEPWIAKPPILYWCVAGLYRVLGVHDWVGRLVSVAAMAGSVQLVYTLAQGMYGRRVAWFASVSFITMGLPIAIGKLLLTDALLLLVTLCTTWLLWRLATVGVTWRRAACFWIALGLAVMVKGPAVFMFAGPFGLGLLLSPARRRWLLSQRLWLTLPLLPLVAVPWYAHVASRAGDTLTEQFIMFEIVNRIVAPTRGYWGPPGYHFVVALVGLMPWTVLVPGAMIETLQRRRSDREAGLLLVWLILPWVSLELIPTKLPHYALPCYVPLAIMLGRMWQRGLGRELPRHERVVAWGWALLPVVGGVGLVITAWLGMPPGVRASWMAAGVVVAAGFVSVCAAVAGRAVTLDRAWPRAVATVGLFHVVVGVWGLPALEPYRLSHLAAERVNTTYPQAERVWVSGYEEPSLFFYLNAEGRPVSPADLGHWLAAPPADAVLLAREGPLLQHVSPDRLAAEGELIAGYNYVTRKATRLWLWRPADPGLQP